MNLEQKGFINNVRIEYITPKMAEEYLTHNTGNRPLSQRLIKTYVDIMNAGKWQISNDAICFDTEGKLLNGQHRLHAVIQSGVTCSFYVGRNFDTDAFSIMDNGKKRSAGDVLSIENINSPLRTAAVAKCVMALRLRRANVSSNKNFSNSDILTEVRSNTQGYIDAMHNGERYYDGMARCLSPANAGSIYYYLTYDMNYDATLVNDFFECLSDLKSTDNETIRSLRAVLVADYGNKQAKMLPRVRELMIIKAWNAWVNGVTIKKLIYNPAKDDSIWFQHANLLKH